MDQITLKPFDAPAETIGMSDLSKVLGDLYGSTDPDAAPVAREPAAKDRVVPTAEEKEPIINRGEDLQSVLNQALAKLPEKPPLEPMNAIEAAEEWAEKFTSDDRHHLHQRGALRAWVRTDDDFLPTQGRKFNKRSKK